MSLPSARSSRTARGAAVPNAGPYWLVDGRLLPDRETVLSPWDRGFRYGDGLYETVRVHRGRIFRLEEHLSRMAAGLAILGIALDPAVAFPAGNLEQLIQATGIAGGEGRLRLFVTRGIDRGSAAPPPRAHPTTLAVVEPLPQGAPASDPRPTRLATVTALAPRPSAWASLKSLNHLPYVLAAAEAVRVGADEALVVYEGRVKETTAANIFAVKSGVLVTPPVSEGLLAGVTRDLVLDLARRLGLGIEERPLAIDELDGAEELFVSGSVAGLRAVTSLDGRPFAEPVPGPVTRRLESAYAELLAAACGEAEDEGSRHAASAADRRRADPRERPAQDERD